MNNKRDSFIFYRSFFEAVSELPRENRIEIWEAICEYSLNFKDIELTGLSRTIFTLIKPQLEANNKRYSNGIKPKYKQNGSKQEAKQKQNGSKSEANNNVNVNDNVNDNNIIYRINGEVLNFEIWTQSIINKSDFIFDEMLMKEPARINFTDDDVKSHETKCIREGTKFSNQNHFRKSLLGYLKTIEQRKTNGKQLNQKDRIGGIDASAAKATLSRLSREPFKPE